MTFLYDYSLLVDPRAQAIWVPNVGGQYLKVPSDPGRKQLPAEEVGRQLATPPAQEVTATTMNKLLRKKGNEAFLGVIGEAQVFQVSGTSGKPCNKPDADADSITDTQKEVL